MGSRQQVKSLENQLLTGSQIRGGVGEGVVVRVGVGVGQGPASHVRMQMSSLWSSLANGARQCCIAVAVRPPVCLSFGPETGFLWAHLAHVYECVCASALWLLDSAILCLVVVCGRC